VLPLIPKSAQPRSSTRKKMKLGLEGGSAKASDAINGTARANLETEARNDRKNDIWG
jgi:hypothetical protein